MDDPLKRLLTLIDVEALEKYLFRGESQRVSSGPSVFGGQVLGQALRAAQKTVLDWRVHSLHAYFLRPGDVNAPIVYDVDPIRDGKSFATRRVVATQHGRAVFNMAASFQIAEEGVSHQTSMPQVTPPEELASDHELRQQYVHRVPPKMRDMFLRPGAVEARPVDPLDPFEPRAEAPEKYVWIKTRGPMPDDLAMNDCLLAYASDFGLMGTAMRPHELAFLQPQLQAASLDHAMWFHRPLRMDEWLLYAMDSPSASGARGLNRGMLFARDGTLVASTCQEGLMRVRPEDADHW